MMKNTKLLLFSAINFVFFVAVHTSYLTSPIAVSHIREIILRGVTEEMRDKIETTKKTHENFNWAFKHVYEMYYIESLLCSFLHRIYEKIGRVANKEKSKKSKCQVLNSDAKIFCNSNSSEHEKFDKLLEKMNKTEFDFYNFSLEKYNNQICRDISQIIHNLNKKLTNDITKEHITIEINACFSVLGEIYHAYFDGVDFKKENPYESMDEFGRKMKKCLEILKESIYNVVIEESSGLDELVLKINYRMRDLQKFYKNTNLRNTALHKIVTEIRQLVFSKYNTYFVYFYRFFDNILSLVDKKKSEEYNLLYCGNYHIRDCLLIRPFTRILIEARECLSYTCFVDLDSLKQNYIEQEMKINIETSLVTDRNDIIDNNYLQPFLENAAYKNVTSDQVIPHQSSYYAPTVVRPTNLIVASRVDFVAKWETPFCITETKRDFFCIKDKNLRGINAKNRRPMMSQVNVVDIAHYKDFDAVKINLNIKEYSFMVVLPKEDVFLDKIDKQIDSSKKLKEIINKMSKKTVRIEIPRFMYTKSLDNKYILGGVKKTSLREIWY